MRTNNSSFTQAFENLPVWLAVAIGVPTLALSFVVAGGVWGWGAATLSGHPRWPAAKTGALSVTGMFMLLEVPVHFSQALPVPNWMPFGVHGAFTVVFVSEIALVAGVASARLSKRLGVDRGHRPLGAKVGLVGAAGGAVGSVLALGLGFRVGAPSASNMVWALYVVVAVAGLTAGWAFGLSVGESPQTSIQDTEPEFAESHRPQRDRALAQPSGDLGRFGKSFQAQHGDDTYKWSEG